MKHCNRCKVDVRGEAEFCPLCQMPLSGTAEEPVFPETPSVFRQFSLFFKILLLGSTAICVAAAAINLALPDTGRWAYFVFLGVGCMWASLLISIRKLYNVANIIMNQAILFSVFCVLWDFATGWRGWSIDYALPVICIVAMVTMEILIKATRIPPNDYIVCTTINAVFGIIPLILYLTGVLNQVIPSLICISVSIIMLVGLLLFKWSDIRIEYMKRFRI